MPKPSTYNKKLCKEICDKVADGGNIKDILKARKYPTYVTFCNWKRQHVELMNMYIGAQQDKAEACIMEINEVLQDLKKGKIESKVARVLIDTLKWKASKFYPKMYAPSAKLDLTSKDKEITQQVTVFQIPDNGRD